MHGIQRYHYERLQGYLKQLQQESKIFQLSSDHLTTIEQQEEKLKLLYHNYQASLHQVAIIIKQYEQEYKSVRQLMISHKQHRKQIVKKCVADESV